MAQILSHMELHVSSPCSIHNLTSSDINIDQESDRNSSEETTTVSLMNEVKGYFFPENVTLHKVP